MRHLDTFQPNITYYPKVLLIGQIIHLTGILKKLTIGMPLKVDEQEKLLEVTMTYQLITDLAATKENQKILMEYAEENEVGMFGFKTLIEFTKAWNEYGQDYFHIMDEAQHGEAGKT